jgi:stage V sporulation protein G
MEITEIRVKLADDAQERLLAFCTVTLDDAFVVRDVKVIEGPKGPFVAMPSRKVTGRCQRCREKNHLRANYCNSCGEKVNHVRAVDDGRGRPRLYVDIAHPINQKCRASMESSVIEAFKAEQKRALEPGYVSPDLDDVIEFIGSSRPVNGSRRASAGKSGSRTAGGAQGSSAEGA